MDKELFEGAVVAGKEKIKKLRKKQYLQPVFPGAFGGSRPILQRPG